MARALRIAPSEPSSGSVGTISAPNASRIAVFWAEEPLAGTQRVTGKPRALPIIASAIPVLPEVASRIVLPGVSNPRRSPSRSMARAGRSLTLPPGFMCSALASRRRPGTPAAMRERSSSGVLPIASRRLTPGALLARAAASACSFIPRSTPRNQKPAGLVRRAQCLSCLRNYRGQTPAPAGPSRALSVQQHAAAFRISIPISNTDSGLPDHRDSQHRAGAGDFTGPEEGARDGRTDDPVGLRRRETVSAQAFADESLREPQPAEQRSLVPPELLPRRLRVPLVNPEPSAGFQGPMDGFEPGLRLLPVMEGENRQREAELVAERKSLDGAPSELEIRKSGPSRRAANHSLGPVHADDREARSLRGEQAVQISGPAADVEQAPPLDRNLGRDPAVERLKARLRQPLVEERPDRAKLFGPAPFEIRHLSLSCHPFAPSLSSLRSLSCHPVVLFPVIPSLSFLSSRRSLSCHPVALFPVILSEAKDLLRRERADEGRFFVAALLRMTKRKTPALRTTRVLDCRLVDSRR